MDRGAPHRAIDGALDGMAGGAKQVATSIGSGLKGAGEAVMSGLDAPIKMAVDRDGPHRMLDDVLDGNVDAVVGAFTQGVMGPLQTVGEGIAKALDRPPRDLLGKGGFPEPPRPWERR